MGNEKLDPRSLQEKAQALITFTREGPLFIAWVQAVTDAIASASEGGKVECVLHEEIVRGGPSKWSCETRPAPESEGGKVECPNCGEMVDAHESVQHGDSSQWFCRALKPAQPEPVAAEMPEALRRAINWLRLDPPQGVDVGSGHADALEPFWRTLAAQPAKVGTEEARRSGCTCLLQISTTKDPCSNRNRPDGNPPLLWTRDGCPLHGKPAKVRMTEELRYILDHLDRSLYAERWGEEDKAYMTKMVAAVRAQAAEAGKVRLPKVRDFLERTCWSHGGARLWDEAKADDKTTEQLAAEISAALA